VNPHTFAKYLLRWAESHTRDLPWKGIKDPYKIWLSEIILQQTRVDQGMPYYHKFVANYPSVHDLARAAEDDVLKSWEGLGYYSRARNLHHTAKYISTTLNGVFPNDYKGLLALKGIGPYTAAAISSFAYEEKQAVIDGNVKRLVARILGITDPIESSSVLSLIEDFTKEAIQEVTPSIFNQALMDHGATICKPKNPFCTHCVFRKYCKAFQQDQVCEIPVKASKVSQTKRWFHFLDIVLPDDQTILQKRSGQDIWKGLYQLPAMESEDLNPEVLISSIEQTYGVAKDLITINKVNHFPFKQKLTHRIILATFYKVTVSKLLGKINEDQYLVKRSEISTFAFPKIITDYLKSNI
jgi:A/G-specific adenine glycosylase